MGRAADEARREPDYAMRRLVSIGAGAYWGAILIDLFGDMESSLLTGLSTARAVDWLSLSYQGVSVLVLALALVFSGRFVRPFMQKLLAAGVVVGTGLWLVDAAPILTSLGSGFGNTCAVLFWGLNFTALDKHGAERTALSALVIAFLVYLVIALLPLGDLAVNFLSGALLIASVIPFLAGRYRLDLEQREVDIPNRGALVPFYVSRAFLGACFGIVSFLCAAAASTIAGELDRSCALIVLVLATIVVFVVRQARSESLDLSFLRIAPVLICGVIACPIVLSCGLDELALLCAPTFVWMGWSVLHAVQISALKDRSGIGDCALSFSEKATFVLSSLIAVAVLDAVTQTFEFSIGDQLCVSFVVVLAFTCVVMCCYLLTRIIDGKETERIADNALVLNEWRNEPVLAQIAADHGLTDRELDVLRVLSKGYARSAICEELCISDGTARTHVTHIYQKLGIHSRNELLALIEEQSRVFVAK